MAHRLSFAIAQTITIVGWLLSSFLLIALVAVGSKDSFQLEPPQNHALTQAYYYAIIAAALYFIISILMVVTVFGTYRGHYEREFRLTVSQRTLMLQTIMFMMYLLMGALIFSKIEGWAYLDAVYWADFTLLTVGIGGDFVPKTHLGRSLLFPYAIGGIVSIGLVVGSVRSLVLERGKHKMEARMTEKTRERVVQSINPQKRTVRISWFNTIKFSEKPANEHHRRMREFHVMRQIQSTAMTRRRWAAFGSSFLAAMLLWLLGAFVFEKAEHGQNWSYFVSLYFAYTSLLTIGYGDLQPTSNAGKPFFVFWSLLAVPTLTILISNMGDTVVKGFSDFTIWAGSLTILPNEKGFRASLKESASRLKKDSDARGDEIRTQLPPGILPNKPVSDRHPDIDGMALGRIAEYLEEEELQEAQQANQAGNPVERDIHFYHHVLSKELRKIMRDISASPPKKYSYHEWAYFLKLIGEDEGDPSRHRTPPVNPKRNGKNNPVSKTRNQDNEKSPTAWSWVGTRSPLMGNKTEAEWLLENIAACLERELKKLRSRKPDEELEPPPISMAELYEYQKRESSTSDKESDEVGAKKDV